MISNFDVCYAFSDRLDNTTSFMSEDDGECTFGIIAREGEGVAASQSSPDSCVWWFVELDLDSRVTDTGATCQPRDFELKRKNILEDLDPDFVLLGRGDLDIFNHEGLG